jgi:glycosyltransferase involved in cell wall biosynthesis
MRVVHVSDAFLPRLGGIEVHVRDLARRQAAQGHEVHVVTTTPAGHGHEPDMGSVTVHRVRGGWVRDLALGSVHATQVVQDLQPDVVHCHNSVLSPLAVAVAATASDAGLPTAITVHSLLPAVGPLLPLSGSLLAMRRAAIAWSAVSAVAAAPVRRVLGPGSHVAMLPNAIDVGWWRAGAQHSARHRAVAGLRERDPREVRVISVGRLATRKRPLALLRMMAEVRRTVPADVPLRLLLVGDGPQRAHVLRRARDLGMADWVELPGVLSSEQIRGLLAGSDVYVAPARLESFGIAALEARAVGLPIVAHARGGVGEFVAQATEGLLTGRDSDMVQALATLAASPGLRLAMRAHNEQVAPAFGWDDALRRTELLYARAGLRACRPVRAVADVPAPRVDVEYGAVR